VWISILLTGGFLVAFLNCYIYFALREEVSKFSSFLFFFSIFVEESYNIPSKLEMNKIYKICTYFWLLTAVVLTNLYISNVISELNAPLKGDKLSKISSLYNSSIIGNFSSTEKPFGFYNLDIVVHPSGSRAVFLKNTSAVINNFEKIHKRHTTYNWFSFLSEPRELLYPHDIWRRLDNPYMYSVTFQNLFAMFKICWRKFGNTTYCKMVTKLMDPSNKHSNKSFTA